MIAALKNFKKDLASRLQVDYNSVVSVVLFNGTAPSLTAAGVQLSQIQVLQYLLAESDDNICLALTPVFSWKKGQVWLEEHGFIKMLATIGNCAVDHQFNLKFNNKADGRDQHPLVYNGRILTASGREPSALWADSKLCAERMAGPAALLAGTNMETVQKVDPTALPATQSATPKGAYRFSQIGVDGWTCLLNTLLDGVSLSARQAILVTDTSLQHDIGPDAGPVEEDAPDSGPEVVDAVAAKGVPMYGPYRYGCPKCRWSPRGCKYCQRPNYIPWAERPGVRPMKRPAMKCHCMKRPASAAELDVPTAEPVTAAAALDEPMPMPAVAEPVAASDELLNQMPTDVPVVSGELAAAEPNLSADECFDSTPDVD